MAGNQTSGLIKKKTIYLFGIFTCLLIIVVYAL